MKFPGRGGGYLRAGNALTRTAERAYCRIAGRSGALLGGGGLVGCGGVTWGTDAFRCAAGRRFGARGMCRCGLNSALRFDPRACVKRCIKNPALQRGKIKNGGPDKDRTCDLLHAMQALSQLSYRPFLLLNYYNSFLGKVQHLLKTEKARKGLFCDRSG